LVYICFHHNPTLDLCDEYSQNLIEYHFYISNDKKHDLKFVQHCFKLHWQYMVDNGHIAPQWHQGCGMMVVHHGSRIISHDTLYHGIQNDWGLKDVLEFF
jgi:hypothetical protein